MRLINAKSYSSYVSWTRGETEARTYFSACGIFDTAWHSLPGTRSFTDDLAHGPMVCDLEDMNETQEPHERFFNIALLRPSTTSNRDALNL